jgi:hypothetical protein
MLRSLATTVVLGTAALGLTALGSATAKPSRSASRPITFVGHQTQLKVSPDFPKPASTLVQVHSDTFHGAGHGSDTSDCVVISTGGTIHCNTTVKLAGGTLEFAFLSSLKGGAIHATLTGGAGRYVNSRGHAIVRDVSSRKIAGTIYLH